MSWYNHVSPINNAVHLRWHRSGNHNITASLIYRSMFMISWLTHFFYLHFTTTVSRKEVPEQYVWWWKLAFLTKWGEIICVLYSVFSFLSVLKGPSVTTKVSPEVVSEVRKCAETGFKPPWGLGKHPIIKYKLWGATSHKFQPSTSIL